MSSLVGGDSVGDRTTDGPTSPTESPRRWGIGAPSRHPSSGSRRESGDERARTANPRLAKPVGTVKFPEENADFQKVGAPGAAVESEIGVSDPDLALIVQQWDSVPKAVRAGIVAMVKAAGRD